MNVTKYLSRLPRLVGKTYVVTGANSGLGFTICKHLLSLGASVIMANRNAEKSNEAQAKLMALTNNHKITYLTYDQASKASIYAFVKDLKGLNTKLDGVVLNAGLFMPGRDQKTTEDVSLTFGVNYLGNYLLLKALVAHDILTVNTRLVFTSSLAGKKSLAHYDLNALVAGTYKSRYRQYQGSKTALNTLIYGLFAKDSLIPFSCPALIYVYHPGVSNSNIARFKTRFMQGLAHFILRLLFHAPEKAVLGVIESLTRETEYPYHMFVPRGLWHINGFPKLIKMDARYASGLAELIRLSETY